MSTAHCPALLVTAPASGQGKTTITAGLARHHRRLGRRVRVFKVGPDFLDPMILERASGAPVYSLDLWMVGEDACSAMLADAAADADLILVEGVMGLYDGTPSSADIAARFNIPVMPVISAKAMAQTFGAVATGLAHYRPGLPFHGVFANRVGSPHHATMLRESLPLGMRWAGHVAAEGDIELPDRHLGLFQASEIADLDRRLDLAADALSGQPIVELPAPVEFRAEPMPKLRRTLEGKRIAVARDAAFSFVYPANLDLLVSLGAELRGFSPLADEAVPDADALYLPGGYPELHAARLTGNRRSAEAIRGLIDAGKPVLAECGGMLYLMEHLTDQQGETFPMLGVLPGHATMQRRLAALGMQQLDTAHGALTGHCFHYSKIETPLTPRLRALHPLRGSPGEALHQQGSVTATYMHGYWPSNPAFITAIFNGQAV
ncbi:cobyrinate a,c-diamide synthase [Lysobacter korlensis]|uniref:Cobyrinate a,c-diamide synthase n=1 Tax=Lysobacter korlensis TaxID=553636 RepID=A0ABV6RTN5_9GAMM